MKLLNLGCGNRFHPDWVNIDFVSSNEKVIAHNLLHGIPFSNESFDAVYHSHVLEHFSKQDGEQFIEECYRVLKPGGIIRIAVPDLEKIVRCYLTQLEQSLKGDKAAALNYDWIMLEMYDQTVRNYSGGNMAKYLFQKQVENLDFVYGRLGQEAKNIREDFLLKQTQKASQTQKKRIKSSKLSKLITLSGFKNKLKKMLFADDLQYIKIGKFRSSGEVHQWMYDRYSLSKLLSDNRFYNICVQTAFDSKIPDWNNFELDAKNGIIHKPDSLFMEAIKTVE